MKNFTPKIATINIALSLVASLENFVPFSVGALNAHGAVKLKTSHFYTE